MKSLKRWMDLRYKLELVHCLSSKWPSPVSKRTAKTSPWNRKQSKQCYASYSFQKKHHEILCWDIKDDILVSSYLNCFATISLHRIIAVMLSRGTEHLFTQPDEWCPSSGPLLWWQKLVVRSGWYKDWSKMWLIFRNKKLYLQEQLQS